MAVKRKIKEQTRSERNKKPIEQVESTLNKVGANKNKIDGIKEGLGV